MARIRTIKPEFWTDSLMVQLDTFTRLLYIGLWTAADDHGAIRDEIDRIAMEIMPRENPDSVKLSLDLLIACGRVTRMLNDDGSSYLIIEKWADHQRVDKPAKSKIIREGSRKLAITPEARRSVASKYGCMPGERKEASCYFCGSPGEISWPRLYSGKPSSWVSFSDLELDHFQPESKGGENSSLNLVLSCRHCNRSRNNKSAFDFVTGRLGGSNSLNPREPSRELLVGKERKGKEQGKENPLSTRVENSSVDNFSQPSETPDPAANNFVMDNRPPSAGGIGAFGKFVMTPDWKPDPDILKQAALWGVALDSEITQQELAQFVSYWVAEGKAYHHTQWQQKLVQSVKTVRTKTAKPERRDIMAMSEPDTEIPPGFRG
ncbi:DnaT-like ssDNA-binding domain-containing protein [Escherichia coli]